MEIRQEEYLWNLRKILPFWQAVSQWFHELKAIDYPRIKSIQKYNKKTAEDTIKKLIRIDGFTEDEIVEVLNFSFYDEFWKKNIYSVCSLRTSGKNGLTKFENIFNKLPKKDTDECHYEKLG
jgi:hypothetical protein